MTSLRILNLLFVFIFLPHVPNIYCQTLKECSQNKTLNSCNGTEVYYCFPKTSDNGCFPRINCTRGSFLVLIKAEGNSSRRLDCQKCPEGQSSDATNSLACKNICPPGQTIVETSGNVVGDAKCREIEKKLGITEIIYVICGIVGFIILCIIAWRCVRYSKCYRKQVHSAKRGRKACAACGRKYFCCACYTDETYSPEEQNDNARPPTGADTAASSVPNGNLPTHSSQGFQNLAYSDRSIDRY